jgi:hypothetical protein
MNYETSNQGYDEGNRGQLRERREGKIARAIESQTAKLPSDVFLLAAGIAMVGSLAFQVLGPRPKTGIFGRRVEGRAPLASFMGQWVPTLLIFGLYNKLVKVAGPDRMSR